MKCAKSSATTCGILWMLALSMGLSLAADNPTGAILKSTPDQLDAGKVAEGKVVEATATIQNLGNSPVEITNVRTS